MAAGCPGPPGTTVRGALKARTHPRCRAIRPAWPRDEPGGTAPGTDEPVEEEEPAEDGAQDDTDEEEGEDKEQGTLESLLTALPAVTALLAYLSRLG